LTRSGVSKTLNFDINDWIPITDAQIQQRLYVSRSVG